MPQAGGMLWSHPMAMKSLSIFIRTLCLPLFGMMPSANAQDSAQVTNGKALYVEFCTLCHGADGKRGQGFQTPIWGQGSLIAKFRNAQGLIEYMQMLMPFNDPALLNDDQKLAVTAYVLANHGAIPANGEITPQSAATIEIK